jgi:hypothetical protein
MDIITFYERLVRGLTLYHFDSLNSGAKRTKGEGSMFLSPNTALPVCELLADSNTFK